MTLIGTRWFITFIDNHTRVCWIYSLKEKSKAKRVFKNFHAKIKKTNFKLKLKYFGLIMKNNILTLSLEMIYLKMGSY